MTSLGSHPGCVGRARAGAPGFLSQYIRASASPDADFSFVETLRELAGRDPDPVAAGSFILRALTACRHGAAWAAVLWEDSAEGDRATGYGHAPSEPSEPDAEERRRLAQVASAPEVRAALDGGGRRIFALASSGSEDSGSPGPSEECAAIPIPRVGGVRGVLVVPADRKANHPQRATSGLAFAESIALAAAHAATASSQPWVVRGTDAWGLITLPTIDACLGAERVEAVLARLAHDGRDALRCRAVAAWVQDEDLGRLRLAAGIGFEDAWGSALLRSAGGWAEETIRERRTTHGACAAVGARSLSYICAPMVSLDETIGAVCFIREGTEGAAPPGGSALEEMRRFAALAALPVHGSRLFSRCRRLRERLQETERRAVRREKLAALGEMSARLAHEIRNPLSAIGGYARKIERALEEGSPLRGHAATVVREIERLETILAEQLQFSCPSQPRLAQVDLSSLVRETLALLREEATRKGVEIIDQTGGGLPGVLVDPGRIKQVLLNILKNALEATARGNRIRVRTRTSDGHVAAEIANDGEEIAAEVLDRLFVPFATGRGRGHGLGLAVADQIIREHGGEILVRRDGEWSVVFTVSLPIRINQERRGNKTRRSGRDRRSGMDGAVGEKGDGQDPDCR